MESLRRECVGGRSQKLHPEHCNLETDQRWRANEERKEKPLRLRTPGREK
jgi:hypothetical protein